MGGGRGPDFKAIPEIERRSGSLSLWCVGKAAFAEEGQCLCDLTRARTEWMEGKDGRPGGHQMHFRPKSCVNVQPNPHPISWRERWDGGEEALQISVD